MSSTLAMASACPPRPVPPSAAPETPAASPPRLVERVDAFLESHGRLRFGLREMASSLGYSESHLRALFRQRTGVSLGSYARRHRVNRAAAMIRDTELNLSEIAERCGFDSLFSFSRSFKSLTGLSPSSYRSRHQSGRTFPKSRTQA